jgi:hypothetical protein
MIEGANLSTMMEAEPWSLIRRLDSAIPARRHEKRVVSTASSVCFLEAK